MPKPSKSLHLLLMMTQLGNQLLKEKAKGLLQLLVELADLRPGHKSLLEMQQTLSKRHWDPALLNPCLNTQQGCYKNKARMALLQKICLKHHQASPPPADVAQSVGMTDLLLTLPQKICKVNELPLPTLAAPFRRKKLCLQATSANIPRQIFTAMPTLQGGGTLGTNKPVMPQLTLNQ